MEQRDSNRAVAYCEQVHRTHGATYSSRMFRTLCTVFVLFNTIYRMDPFRNYIKNTRTDGRTEGQGDGKT